ncbi:MAG: hypothetical protein KDD45_04315 [Bdellovibrionales bacterium]|nr:hypothetical protein [Bdellovibrionales bacterium]
MGEVLIEVDTLIYIAHRHIIPGAFSYLKTISGGHNSVVFDKYNKEVRDKLEKVIVEVKELEHNKKEKADSLAGCQELREEMIKVGESVTELMKVIPNNSNFPDQSEFLNL